MRRSIWIAGLIVGGSGVAAAQENAFMIPNDREASAQVASIIASAKAANLPTNPIIAKVSYGVNRARAKPAAIVHAASTVRSRLEMAREALAPNPTEPEITNGASALGEKATIETLREVRRAGAGQSVAAALGLLTQLLATERYKLPEATRMVTDLLRSQATLAQLVAMGNDLAEIQNKSHALASAEQRLHELIATAAAQRTIAAERAGNALTASDAPTKGGTPGTTPPNPPPRRP
jgi:hypothetical protein